ncbi:TIGR03546 family protein [Salinibius halmophilus]|uniref:TIGR03546 family protein n=1 Tax=Salinibius halmophilus TaxID=1853216 RepID=UPI000E6612A9|nr:TIGR03546 family protein [Salinibius halmophilus]
MLDAIVRLLKALNSDVSPWAIAFGLTLGMIIGYTPTFTWHNLVVLLLICVLRVNFSSAIAGMILGAALAWPFSAPAIALGETLLTHPELQSFWTTLFNIPFMLVLGLNHTHTLGSLLVALIALLPLTLLVKFLVERYRLHVMAWFNKLKVVQALKASKFWGLLTSIYGLRG